MLKSVEFYWSKSDNDPTYLWSMQLHTTLHMCFAITDKAAQKILHVCSSDWVHKESL
jgi:hypothetical protein